MRTLYIHTDSVEISRMLDADEQGNVVNLEQERSPTGSVSFIFDKATFVISRCSWEDKKIFDDRYKENYQLISRLYSMFGMAG